MVDATKCQQQLPSSPALTTRLYLQRLENQGLTSTKKLSASHWETINRLELAAAATQVPLTITCRSSR